MADACRNWLVLHSTSQCRLLCIYVMSDACKHWLTFLVGCWHLFPLAHKPYLVGGCRWPMSISLNWCTHSIGNLCVGFDDDECRRLTSHAICVQTTLDEWRLWLILHINWTKSIGQCIQAKTEFAQNMCPCHFWHVQALADATYNRSMPFGQHAQAMTNFFESMFMHTDDVYMRCVVQPPIGQCLLVDLRMLMSMWSDNGWSRPVNVLMPRLMSEGLEWGCMWLGNIAFEMHIYHTNV